jgi:glycosyltransferase involved in cell wall biosynthesis/uncharacterized membrane protein YbhN (UPF0104 family)
VLGSGTGLAKKEENQTMNNETPPHPHLLAAARQLLFFIIFTLFIFYVYRHWQEFRFIFSLQTLYLLPVLALNGVGLLLSGYRLYLVLAYFSRPISYLTAFKYFILGGFINKFLPLGGGLFRLMMFKRDSQIRYRDGISTLISFGWLNALVSLAAGIFIIGITEPGSRFQQVPVIGIFLALLLIQVLSIPVLRFLVKKFHFPPQDTGGGATREPLPGLRRLVQIGGDIVQRTTDIMKNQPILWKSTLIILFNIGITIAVLHLLFQSIGKPIDLTLATILTVTLRLSSVVELTPGNLGIREFLCGFLTSGLGQGMAPGITISMMWRLIAIFNKGFLSLLVLMKDKPVRPAYSTGTPPDTGEKKQGIFLLGPSVPFRGGISHYNTLLYNHLRQKHEVTFYTFKKQYFQCLFPGRGDKDHSTDKIEPDSRKLDEHSGSRVKQELHPLDIPSWIKAGKEARKYPLILLPWWVIFWAPYYLFFLAVAKNSTTGNKILFLCHNVEEHEGGIVGGLKRLLTRRVLQKGDGFILHSRGQAHQLTQLLQRNHKPVIVSPHPLYQVFNKNRYTAATAREELGIPPRQKVALFFGFIRKYKGLEGLLNALPLVKAYDPDFLLLIVGEVWKGKRQYRHYLRLIKKLDLETNTRFINRYVPNEEVEVYFKASDFVVLPYTDGSGSGILQIAYGMDRPVVATGISVFADVVEEGKTGILVPPNNEKELAEAMIKMYQNNAIPHMETAIRCYKKRFEWSVMVEQITRFYNS